MRRRFLLFTLPLLPLALLASRFRNTWKRRPPSPERIRAQALRLEGLASHTHTPEDAKRFVDCVAAIFADQLPRALKGSSLRNRLARAEYVSATDPQQGIPEQRVADAWNAYARTIQAPEASIVSAAEVHNLRDAFLTSARLSWHREYKNFWAIPSLYATQPDGSLAPGCRAVEAIRLLWDFANHPDNLLGARDRVQKDLLFSEQFSQTQPEPQSPPIRRLHAEARMINNPVRAAAGKYIEQHGRAAFNQVVRKMLDHLIAAD